MTTAQKRNFLILETFSSSLLPAHHNPVVVKSLAFGSERPGLEIDFAFPASLCEQCIHWLETPEQSPTKWVALMRGTDVSQLCPESWKSKCLQDCFLLRAVQGRVCSRPLSLVCRQPLPPCVPPIVFLLCVSVPVSKCPLFIGTPVILDWGQP